MNERLPIDWTRNPTSEPARSVTSQKLSETEIDQRKIGFAKRLREAFPGMNNAEIARRTNTTDTTIKNYTDAARFPVVEQLLEIERASGVNLHWLITGEGSKYVNFDGLFSQEEEEVIFQLAKQHGITFEGAIRKFAVTGLVAYEQFFRS